MKIPWWKRPFVREVAAKAVLFEPVPVDRRECPGCGETVAIWRTYPCGRIRCVQCGEPE